MLKLESFDSHFLSVNAYAAPCTSITKTYAACNRGSYSTLPMIHIRTPLACSLALTAGTLLRKALRGVFDNVSLKIVLIKTNFLLFCCHKTNLGRSQDCFIGSHHKNKMPSINAIFARYPCSQLSLFCDVLDNMESYRTYIPLLSSPFLFFETD